MRARKLHVEKLIDLDGLLLINLFEIISKQPIGQRYNKTIRFPSQNTENVGIALQFASNLGLKIVGISSQSILEKNPKLIGGLIWLAILKYSVENLLEEEGESSKKTLLEWANTAAKDHGLQIVDFQKSFDDALPFLAIYDNHFPNEIDFSQFKAGDREKNFALARELWEKKNYDFELNPELAESGYSEKAIHSEVASLHKFLSDDKSRQSQAKNWLLEWARSASSGHELDITDLNKSWQNGLGFLAIYDNAYPGEFSYSEFVNSTPDIAFEKAYELWSAKEHNFVLDPLHAFRGYDEKSILLELAELYHFLEQESAKKVEVKTREVEIELEQDQGIERVSFNFHIDYYTHLNQAIFIYGNVPELGNYERKRALKMTYENPDSWGITTDISYKGTGSEFQYRYFVATYKDVVAEETSEAHIIKFEGVLPGTVFVIDDMYHDRGILDGYNSSVNWSGIRNVLTFDTPVFRQADLGSDSVRLYITAYAPSVKADQNLKLVIQETGAEVILSPDKFPYFEGSIDLLYASFPVTYKYGAILPDGYVSYENLVHSPRVEITDQKYVRVDDWIVKPFN